LLAINHNIRSFITKILGEKSPMYDIEHICLFDKKTIRTLCNSNGFEVVHVAGLSNSYTLAYAAKMFPLPSPVKSSLVSLLAACKLDNINLRVPGGNMVTVCHKI